VGGARTGVRCGVSDMSDTESALVLYVMPSCCGGASTGMAATGSMYGMACMGGGCACCGAGT
jgi:hypothetical protein